MKKGISASDLANNSGIPFSPVGSGDALPLRPKDFEVNRRTEHPRTGEMYHLVGISERSFITAFMIGDRVLLLTLISRTVENCEGVDVLKYYSMTYVERLETVIANRIGEEIEEFERDEALKAPKAKSISIQMTGLWADLKPAVRSRVDQIKNTPALIEELGGQLEYEERSGGNIFEVRKPVFPSLRIWVVNNGSYIFIERSAMANAQASEIKEFEDLKADLNPEGRLYLVPAGAPDRALVHLQDAVEYLLKPFLN